MGKPIDKRPVNVRFGNRLRDLREQMHYSQEQFAFVLGFGRTYVGALERGEKSPTLDTLDRIAKRLHVTVAELV